MRRLLVVRFDAFQFQRLHGGGLPLDFFLESFQQLTLLDDHAVQLFDLMLKVGEIRFKLVGAPGIFVWHETNLPVPPPEVETVNDLAMS
jgi:hypothetical protein